MTEEEAARLVDSLCKDAQRLHDDIYNYLGTCGPSLAAEALVDVLTRQRDYYAKQAVIRLVAATLIPSGGDLPS